MMRRVSAALVAMVVTGAAVTVAAQSTPKSTIIQKIIVKVNGEIFTQAELERLQIDELQQRARRQVTAQDLNNDAALRSALGEVTPGILVDAIDELLMVQRGRELGAKFSDEIFKNFIDNIKKQNNLDDAGLKTAMTQQGLTMEELRQNAERAFFVQHVQRQEIPVALTESEARAYHKAHPEEFLKPGTVTVRQISISLPDTSVAAEQAAQAKLKTIDERLGKGEDFARVVEDVSDGDKTNGGLIADVELGVINPTFREALDKLKPGERTAPIKTDNAYVIFKLESRTESQPLPFDDVRDQILQKIYEERLDTETRKHIEKLRAQALIEWKDEGYKQMYERAMAERKAKQGQ
jgi:parvulin-like peptidyl-prolyl isomerase